MIKFIKNKLKSRIFEYVVNNNNKHKLLNRILNKAEKEALQHINHGFLCEKGWWESWIMNAPVDKNRRPLPWVTYSFIDFIENRLKNNMTMFEFGSGNSTMYYSSKVKEVHTVENDLEWFEKIENLLPYNVKIIYKELGYGGDYSKTSSHFGIKYDIIIVDGRDRVNCIINSLSVIKNEGVIVLDDSERTSYAKAINKLRDSGYKCIDFWGISPGFNAYNKCTSIFYKSGNVLEI